MSGLVTVAVHSLTEEVIRAMLLTKIKVIVLGLFILGAVAAGAGVLAQTPSDSIRATKPASSISIGVSGGAIATNSGIDPVAATRPDPDRLRDVEAKLDRILEALGGRRSDTYSSYQPAKPAVETVPPGGIGRPMNDLQTTSPAPVERRGFTGTQPATVDPTGRNSTDRLSTMERRMADLERRMADLERRINPSSTTTGTPASSPTVSASPF